MSVNHIKQFNVCFDNLKKNLEANPQKNCADSKRILQEMEKTQTALTQLYNLSTQDTQLHTDCFGLLKVDTLKTDQLVQNLIMQNLTQNALLNIQNLVEQELINLAASLDKTRPLCNTFTCSANVRPKEIKKATKAFERNSKPLRIDESLADTCAKIINYTNELSKKYQARIPLFRAYIQNKAPLFHINNSLFNTLNWLLNGTPAPLQSNPSTQKTGSTIPRRLPPSSITQRVISNQIPSSHAAIPTSLQPAKLELVKSNPLTEFSVFPTLESSKKSSSLTLDSPVNGRTTLSTPSRKAPAGIASSHANTSNPSKLLEKNTIEFNTCYHNFFYFFYKKVLPFYAEVDTLKTETQKNISDIEKRLQEITNSTLTETIHSNTQKSISERKPKITTTPQYTFMREGLGHITTELKTLCNQLLAVFDFPEGTEIINNQLSPIRMQDLWQLIEELSCHVGQMTVTKPFQNHQFNPIPSKKNALYESIKIQQEIIKNVEKIQEILSKILTETDDLVKFSPNEKKQINPLQTPLNPKASDFIPGRFKKTTS